MKRSKKQEEAWRKNFLVFRLKGARTVFARVLVQYGIDKAGTCLDLTSDIITELKKRGKDERA